MLYRYYIRILVKYNFIHLPVFLCPVLLYILYCAIIIVLLCNVGSALQYGTDYRWFLLLWSIPRAELTVMFETDLYPVNEDVGSLSYQLIASSTASFPYQVIVTAVDGSARCEYMAEGWLLRCCGLLYSMHVHMSALFGLLAAACSRTLLGRQLFTVF